MLDFSRGCFVWLLLAFLASAGEVGGVTALVLRYTLMGMGIARGVMGDIGGVARVGVPGGEEIEERPMANNNNGISN